MSGMKENTVGESEFGESLDNFVVTEWLKVPFTSMQISRTSFIGGRLNRSN